MEDKLLGAISLCRKAGKLTMGADAAAEQTDKGAARLVVLAKDIAARSERQIRFVCERKRIDALKLPLTMEELSGVAGRICGIYAVCDPGFAGMIRKQLLQGEQTPG